MWPTLIIKFQISVAHTDYNANRWESVGETKGLFGIWTWVSQHTCGLTIVFGGMSDWQKCTVKDGYNPKTLQVLVLIAW